MNRSQLLEMLKSIQPVVIDPVMTYDMGMECTIATKDGVVYAEPGMFLFCGGYWPIVKLSPSDKGFVEELNTYSIRTSKEETLQFTDIEELEKIFIDMLDLDSRWEEMSDTDLMEWQETISSKGKSILSVAEAE